jgi:predicted CXXCH cytochrome family protein
MAFCLIHERSGDSESIGPQNRTVLEVRRLTIGSAADQHLHLPLPGIAPRHAVLIGTRGRLLLRMRHARAVLVNGRRVRRATLSPGDCLQLGDALIRVRRPLAGGVFALRIAPGLPHQETPGSERTGRGLSVSFWSWSLTVTVSVLFLLVPLAGFLVPPVGKVLRNSSLLPSDALWNPGPLHNAHQAIGARCDACHRNAFVRVQDQQCAACHPDVQHHVDARGADVGLFAGRRCESCHREHKQPAALVQSDARLCTDCHAHLQRLKPNTDVADVEDFGLAHPEFRVSAVSSSPDGNLRVARLTRSQPESFLERSHLTFSHLKHLDPKGIKSPTGDRVLTCQDCHRPDALGREMAPIRMTTHCSGCHSLRFDEHDPASAVPHGDLKAALRAVQEHFSRLYVERVLPAAWVTGPAALRRRPGDVEPAPPGADQAAMAWVNGETATVARELMEKRLCFECHEVTRVPGGTGLEQWRIWPVKLTGDWMPMARFNHAAHSTQKCTGCHDGAARSEHASDILMPTIAKCRECHGGAQENSKVTSSCLMCHPFHRSGQGRFLTAAAGHR